MNSSIYSGGQLRCALQRSVNSWRWELKGGNSCFLEELKMSLATQLSQYSCADCTDVRGFRARRQQLTPQTHSCKNGQWASQKSWSCSWADLWIKNDTSVWFSCVWRQTRGELCQYILTRDILLPAEVKTIRPIPIGEYLITFHTLLVFPFSHYYSLQFPSL